MNNVIEAIEGLKSLNHLMPATTAEIEGAEHKLNLLFADDFKEYVQSYGVISAKGIELTGITNVKRLDVVSVTQEARKMNNIPSEMYVIENMGIDGILILQNGRGEIYSITPNQNPRKICDSLMDYILRRIE